MARTKSYNSQNSKDKHIAVRCCNYYKTGNYGITGAGNGIEISDFFFLCTEKHIDNSKIPSGSDKVIKLIAGEHASAVASGAGDKEITIEAARDAESPAMIDQIESARFKKGRWWRSCCRV